MLLDTGSHLVFFKFIFILFLATLLKLLEKYFTGFLGTQ